ncbi:hypothetical protein OPLHCY645_09380 [Clostridium tetani]
MKIPRGTAAVREKFSSIMPLFFNGKAEENYDTRARISAYFIHYSSTSNRGVFVIVCLCTYL